MQRYDDFSDEPYIGKKKTKDVQSVPPRKFKHELDTGSRAAAITVTPNAPTTVLNNDQLQQCGNEYVNNGVVRGVIDRTVFFVQGDRTKFSVEPNDELTDSVTDEEEQEFQTDIAEDTLQIEREVNEEGEVIIQAQKARVKDLRRKTIRLNKRCKLYENIERLITSALVFGRGALEIKRLPRTTAPPAPVQRTTPEGEPLEAVPTTEPQEAEEGRELGEWPVYGEPIALIHLASRKIQAVKFNESTQAFEGIYYATNDPSAGSTTRFIKSTNLIWAVHDDQNIYENTRGSGLSAVWPIISVAQSDDVINDEDIPEITKNTGGTFTEIYAGTNDDNKISEITRKVKDKTVLVHGNPDLRVTSYPLGRDPMELPNVRNANGKYITQCMSLPLFLMYEDTANFATANQTMQTYKAGVLKRYRVWLQGILEEFWYDTILADHLGIEVRDVIAAPIKIKPVFGDINFEVRKDIIEADEKLFNMDVFNRQDIAKDIDRKDIVQRLDEEDAKAEEQRDKAVEESFMNLRNNNLQLQQQNQGLQQANQNQQNNQLKAAQRASIAASTAKQEDDRIFSKRIQALDAICNLVNKINQEGS